MATTEDFRLAFSSPAGQKVLKELREQFYDVDFDPDWSITRTAFQAGQFSLIRYILDRTE